MHKILKLCYTEAFPDFREGLYHANILGVDNTQLKLNVGYDFNFNFLKNLIRQFLKFIIIVSPSFVFAQKQLFIKGNAPLLNDGTEISLIENYPKRILNESPIFKAKVQNHHFQFLLKVKGAGLYHLKIPQAESKRIFLSAGEANITIADSALNSVKVDKNKAAEEFITYDQMIDSVSLFSDYSRARVDYDVYTRKGVADSVVAQKKLRKRDSILTALQHQLTDISLNWIKQHPSSTINTYVLYDQIAYVPENDVKKSFDAMPLDVKNNIWGKELRYNIDSLFIGGMAPEFSQTDTTGSVVKSTSFRGKYVLLDFWASWCVPCRSESANLVNAFTRFKGKNFTIVSVSIDRNRAAWINAIKQDKLNWTHLSSLTGWQNNVSKQYNVYEVPSNYLLDPTGKIIAKDLYSNDLQVFLNKLFIY